jgi:hypothetical protein
MGQQVDAKSFLISHQQWLALCAALSPQVDWILVKNTSLHVLTDWCLMSLMQDI